MDEISTSELRTGDVGSRVVVIDETGNAYIGTLADVSATRWKWGDRDEDKVRIGLKITSAEGSELTLRALPLNFRLQVERGEP